MQHIVINGFGRIGRSILRVLLYQNKDHAYKITVNDPTPKEKLIYLFKYDSVHGVSQTPLDNVNFTHHKIPAYDENVDIVLECSGQFLSFDKAYSHINAGAKKVLISTNLKDAEETIIYGVNHHKLRQEHKIISNGSCTTNCTAPLLHIFHQEFSVKACHFTTVHSYTVTQNLVDGNHHKDLRRGRAAALSIVPSTTGASKALARLFPDISITGAAYRVPTPNVSVVDMIFETQKPVSQDHIHEVMQTAAAMRHDGQQSILRYNTEEIVSIDCNSTPYSAIFDATQTQVIHPHLVKISAFYDNEWGFASRMVDVMECWLNESS
ncbi:MAG: hypothetical protein H6850_02050 [Alphaproteobacteria bacterium]|nr:MAG: hypothetical protein H6850_02050 [Alphaproteobacteria bacterium]